MAPFVALRSPDTYVGMVMLPPPGQSRTPRLTRRLTRSSVAGIIVAIWAAVFVVVGASLMVGHWYTLPRPAAEDPDFASRLASLRGDDADGWFAVHVLYSKCRCSQRVFDHLFESERPQGVAEAVLLVGADDEIERRASSRGFDLHVVTPRQLAQEYRIEAAPLLAVLSPTDQVRYAGGYTDRKQGYDVRDVEILRNLIDGEESQDLPLFGCGVSKELQQLLDPFGLKY